LRPATDAIIRHAIITYISCKRGAECERGEERSVQRKSYYYIIFIIFIMQDAVEKSAERRVSTMFVY